MVVASIAGDRGGPVAIGVVAETEVQLSSGVARGTLLRHAGAAWRFDFLADGGLLLR